MTKFPKKTTRFTLFKWLWKPVVATGIGGTALVISFEEILDFVAKFIRVIFITILTAIINIFNIIVFKSFEINVDDLKKIKGVQYL